MTKVIENIELLKKIESYLEDVKTEYICCIDWEDNWQFSWHTERIVKSDTKNIEIYDWWDKCQSGTDFYKTLTLEELIEFIWKNSCRFTIPYRNGWTWTTWLFIWDEAFESESLMWIYIEMVKYLDDNDIL